MFRGIFQEDSGFIMPPFVDVGVSLYRRRRPESVTVNGGCWNSIHSGPSGSGNDAIERSAWYEADYYASVTFTVGKWKPGALFTSYTSPNDAFDTVARARRRCSPTTTAAARSRSIPRRSSPSS